MVLTPRTRSKGRSLQGGGSQGSLQVEQLIYARRMEKPAPADRIELMQTFVRIVEAGSLSAAATQMGTTQPTVSRRLQALERSLGVRLLQRSTHAMKLTEDGERCFDRAKELIQSWGAFEAELRGVGDQPRAGCAWWRRTPRAAVAGRPAGRVPAAPSAGDGRMAAARQPARPDARLHRRGRRLCDSRRRSDDPAVVAIRLSEVPRIDCRAFSFRGCGRSAHPPPRAGSPALAGRAQLLPHRGRADARDHRRGVPRADPPAPDHRQPLRPAAPSCWAWARACRRHGC